MIAAKVGLLEVPAPKGLPVHLFRSVLNLNDLYFSEI